MTPEQIAADKKLCEAATPGPWRQDHADDDGFGIEGFLERKQPDGRPDPQIVCEVWQHEPEGKHNAAFIARFNPKTALEYIAALAEKDARIAKLEARLALATKALGKIAEQDTAEEMGAEAAEDADWETAYGIMVGDAREALRGGMESK